MMLISYRIELLVTNSFHSGTIPSGTLCANLNWLKETLLPKLKTWAETIKLEDINATQEKIHSLALVDVEEYTMVYNEMKSKYAESLIKVINSHLLGLGSYSDKSSNKIGYAREICFFTRYLLYSIYSITASHITRVVA